MVQFDVKDLNHVKNFIEGKVDEDQVDIDPFTGQARDYEKELEMFEKKANKKTQK